MLNFDILTSALAVVYFLGIFLHYTHIRTIFVLNDMSEQMNHTKAMFNSSVWVFFTLQYFLMFLLPDFFFDEDDEDY